MRDAILLAELSSMIGHLETGSATARPVVYYRYFTKRAESAVKAATIEEALACIEAVLVRKSRGETDIESALIESFAQIAVELDRYAARLGDISGRLHCTLEIAGDNRGRR